MLAALQSTIHLYYDYDKLGLPTTPIRREPALERDLNKPTTILQIREDLPKLARTIFLRAIGLSMAAPVLYALFFRSAAWKYSLLIAEIIWDVPHSRLSYIPPYHITLIVRSFTSSSLLLALWELSNIAFSAYAAQEPLKNGQPFTSESKDPNGTLLLGLQSRREVPRVGSFHRPV